MIKSDKIIILGGGSAGWMTAATLIKRYPNKNISVIESSNTPTVGVGESTLGQINNWLNFLEIKDEDFMSKTDSSYKLSIKFTDFYKKGCSFHYPFSKVYEKDLSELKQNWFVKKYFDKNLDNSDYATFLHPNMALVNNNRIFKNTHNTLPNFNFQYDVAYHFDASKFGIWLRDSFCIPRGVKHIVEDINDIQSDENGITSLNGRDADLYFDCTGFRSLLMNKLNIPFNSYEDLLPNNKAWATRVPYNDKEKQLEPFTNCTALNNGWVWNIPSWERIGTGYVYSDKYTTDEDALKEFKKHLSSKGLNYSNSDFKNISMRVGLHEDIFVKNVCAIGLSAGFIEPLESNGLLSVHEFLLNLIPLMDRNNGKLSSFDKLSFNKTCKEFFNRFADFVAMHYALSQRDDTEYWKEISQRDWQKVSKSDSFDKNIEVFMNNNNFYNSITGIGYVSTGMNYHGVCKFYLDNSSLDLEKFKIENDRRDKLVEKWNNIALMQPTIFQYLKDNIYNKE